MHVTLKLSLHIDTMVKPSQKELAAVLSDHRIHVETIIISRLFCEGLTHAANATLDGQGICDPS